MQRLTQRLDPTASHEVFDALMRTLAEPGRPRRIRTDLIELPSPALLALALCDVDVDFAVVGDDTAATEVAIALSEATRSDRVDLAVAGHVVHLAPPADLSGHRRGTALAPELGARVAIPVGAIGSGPRYRLSGAGVPGVLELSVDGVSPSLVTSLGRASGTFPTGLDTWLFADDGTVVAISRSTTIQFVED